MFTTESVAISEAGISSPDSACLHLQENLERVREIGRGASGVVYKAIHVPTLKVIAVKVRSLLLKGSILKCCAGSIRVWTRSTKANGAGIACFILKFSSY